MHVLSVPPAFVLSQDQTLYDMVYIMCVSTLEISILIHNACVITCVFFSLFLTFSIPVFHRNKGISRVVTFSCIVQFSRCCLLSSFRATAYLLYHNFKLLSIPFSSFFKNFFSVVSAAHRAALIVYHFRITLSRAFLKISENLFSIVQNHFRFA